MATSDLTPWKHRHAGQEGSAIASLHNEVDRLFENFFSGGHPLWRKDAFEGTLSPDIDVSETDKEIQVTAEIPGVDEKDIDVTLSDGMLTIKGEKKSKSEEKDKHYHRVERSYGSFRRTLSVPETVDEKKVAATFKNGVLTVTVPKKKSTKPAAKKVPIRAI